MADMVNQIVIVGRAVDVPEWGYNAGGIKRAEFKITTQGRRGSFGERFSIIAWNENADACLAIARNSKVSVTGMLESVHDGLAQIIAKSVVVES